MATTQPEAQVSVRTPRRHAIVSGFLLVIATLVLAVTVATFVINPGLGQIDPTVPTPSGGIAARPIGIAFFVQLLLPAVACLVISFIPGACNAHTQRRFGSVVASVAALIATGAAYWLVQASYFTHVDDDCLRIDCWPLPYQGWAICAPPILLALALLAGSLSASRRRLLLATPAAVWVVSVVVQRLIWNDVALPIFSNPPS